MMTSAKIIYRVEVKLTATRGEATSTGFAFSKYRSTPIIYVSLDADFKITSETMPEFIRLVRQQVPLQTLLGDVFGDDYNVWIESHAQCP